MSEMYGQRVVRLPGNPDIREKEQPDSSVDLLKLFSNIWNGKFLLMCFALLAVVGGLYVALFLVEPRYSSTTKIVLDEPDQGAVDFGSVVTGLPADLVTLNTEIDIIRARPLLEQLVVDLDLMKDPEFNLQLRPQPRYSLSKGIDWIKKRVLPEEEEEVSGPPDERGPLLSTVRMLDSVISVENTRDTFIFEIEVTTGDPQKSADIANRLAEIYLDNQIETKFSATEYAVNWLSERVSDLETQLRQQEDAIVEKSSTTELMNDAALEALRLRAAELRLRIGELSARRDAALSQATRLSDLLAQGEFAAVAQLADDTVLNGLLAEANDNGAGEAAFRERADALAAVQRTRARNDEGQLAPLQAPYDALLQQIDAEDAQRQELIQLTRDADATRVLYETFLARLKETSLQIGLERADSRVLSSAIRGVQVQPQVVKILAMSFMLGIALGVAVIVIRQMIQRGMITSSELEMETGQTVLGQIPIVPRLRRRKFLKYLENNPTSELVETVRNLRTSVILSNVDKPPQVLMITSSLPGEGKTTLSIALAQNLSGLGKRVLLVEGDIRRRTLDQYVTSKAQGNLLQVLSGTMTIGEAVVPIPEANIDMLLGSGSKMNAADVFSSDKFTGFMQQARDSYDYVVIDTPPVLAVPDARVIGRHADALIYAVKWNSTLREHVNDGLRQLTSIGLKVTGLAMTQVDQRRMRKYGYSPYNKYVGKYYAK